MCWQQCSATRPASRAGGRKKLTPGAAPSCGHLVAGSLLVRGLARGLSTGPSGCLLQSLLAAGSLLSTGLSDGLEGGPTSGWGLGTAMKPGIGGCRGKGSCACIDAGIGLGNGLGNGNGMGNTDDGPGWATCLGCCNSPMFLRGGKGGGGQARDRSCLLGMQPGHFRSQHFRFLQPGYEQPWQRTSMQSGS